MQRSIDDNNDSNGRCDFDDSEDSYDHDYEFFQIFGW